MTPFLLAAVAVAVFAAGWWALSSLDDITIDIDCEGTTND